jgi:thymidylate kinase
MGAAYLASPFHRIAYYFFASFVPKLDLMFFLDIRPQEDYRRILQTRRKREMFESMNELRKVRAKGLSLALIDKWKIIDANRSIEEVGTEIRKKLVHRDTR